MNTKNSITNVINPFVRFVVITVFTILILCQNAASASYDFRVVKFTSETEGIILTGNGEILKTTDQGATWVLNNITNISNTGILLNDLLVLNSSTYIACGEPNTLIKTTDGGLHWRAVANPCDTGLKSLSLSGTVLWAAGNNGSIIYSFDEGENWYLKTSFVGEEFNCIQFSDQMHGFAAGNKSAFFKTTNGGAYWEKVSYNNTSLDFNSVSMSSPLNGSVAGPGGLLLTTIDGGFSWLTPDGITTKSDFKSVVYSSPLNGTAVGDNLTVYNTMNGGLSWSGSVLPGFSSQVRFSEVTFVTTNNNGHIGVLVGENNTILLTNDEGLTWRYRLPSDGERIRIVQAEPPPSLLKNAVNYPNPFNPDTKISYTLKKTSDVTIYIFDVTGKSITLISHSVQKAGTQYIKFDGSSLPSGIYFAKISVRNESEYSEKILKMILTK